MPDLMEKPETKIRVVELPKRTIGPFDIFSIGFTGFGVVFLVFYLVFGERSVFDYVFLSVFFIILIWLAYGIIKSLQTKQRFHVASSYIEIESTFRGKSRITHIDKNEIQSIEIKSQGFFSIYTKQLNYIIALRVLVSLGLYQIPMIDCGSSFIYFAEFHTEYFV